LSAAKELVREEILPERMQYLVILDESWLFLNDCSKKSPICYVDAGDHVPENRTEVRHENFGPKIMTVGILTGRGPVDLIFVPSKVKIDARFYLDYVLKPLVKKILPKLYPDELDKVWVHHDAAPATISARKSEYIEHVTRTKGIRFILNSQIPVKGPDCSPLFCIWLPETTPQKA